MYKEINFKKSWENFFLINQKHYKLEAATFVKSG